MWLGHQRKHDDPRLSCSGSERWQTPRALASATGLDAYECLGDGPSERGNEDPSRNNSGKQDSAFRGDTKGWKSRKESLAERETSPKATDRGLQLLAAGGMPQRKSLVVPSAKSAINVACSTTSRRSAVNPHARFITSKQKRTAIILCQLHERWIGTDHFLGQQKKRGVSNRYWKHVQYPAIRHVCWTDRRHSWRELGALLGAPGDAQPVCRTSEMNGPPPARTQGTHTSSSLLWSTRRPSLL